MIQQPVIDGAVLIRLRYARRLTTAALAEKSGVGVRTIRRIENGHVTRPNVATVSALADALEVEPAALLPGRTVVA